MIRAASSLRHSIPPRWKGITQLPESMYNYTTDQNRGTEKEEINVNIPAVLGFGPQWLFSGV